MTDRFLFVLKGFSKFTDADLLIFAKHVLEMMAGNVNFPSPAVSMAALATIIAAFQAALAELYDGGKNAAAAKDNIRAQLVKVLRQLAFHVEGVADGDPSIVASSGFQTRSQISHPQPQPAVPHIRKILNGASGELLVYVKAEQYAKAYNLRYGPVSTDPESWVVRPVAGVKSAVSVNGLTPGIVYGFQVSAVGNEGGTAWSDTVTHMSM